VKARAAGACQSHQQSRGRRQLSRKGQGHLTDFRTFVRTVERLRAADIGPFRPAFFGPPPAVGQGPERIQDKMTLK
jgi:hypothetical protein